MREARNHLALTLQSRQFKIKLFFENEKFIMPLWDSNPRRLENYDKLIKFSRNCFNLFEKLT